MYKIIFILFFLLLSFVACKQNSETAIFDVPSGSYAYFGYDTSFILVAKGWYKFEYEDSVNVQGIWELEKTGDPGNIGPQNGRGKLFGTISDGSISIDFQPGSRDNNIILNGRIEDKYIYGKWLLATEAGTTNWGNFNSKKN